MAKWYDPRGWELPDVPDTPDVSAPDAPDLGDIGGDQRASRLKKLAGAGVAGTLIAFADDPTEFILNRLLTALVTMVIRAAETVVGFVLKAGSLVAEIPGQVGSPLFLAGDTLLESLLTLIDSLTLTLGTIVSGAGPFAPILTVGLLVLIGIAFARLVSLGFQTVIHLW